MNIYMFVLSAGINTTNKLKDGGKIYQTILPVQNVVAVKKTTNFCKIK